MPEEGTLKINVDGAFSQESGTGATGAVLRGNSGNFLAAPARWLESLGSALLAKEEALWDGIQLIPEGTGERISVEKDSQKLVSLWNNRRKHRCKISAILDVVEEMTSSFTSFQVIHTRRSTIFCSSFVCPAFVIFFT
jgi:ribonuclease HI